MRTLLAAGLLALAGTGCCETCRWCHGDVRPVRSEGPPIESPPVQPNRSAAPVGATAQPPAPAGRPVGAYGGTGN